jgi:transcriptional regulator with XRE-family HTH domain
MILGMMSNMPAKDRTLSKFGLNVARLRAAKGFSQEKLAEKASIDRTYVSGIERGVRNPGIKTVFQIAKALDVSITELCEGVS